LIYIDDMLIHTDTHKKHLEALEQVLLRLHQNHLKINLDKCLFRDDQVSYLGFTLTPQGVKPGKAKLRAIRDAAAPNDVISICSFVGLCNFFQNHIQNFAITAAPLFQLTRQESEYTSGTLPKPAQEAFETLQKQLCQEPTLALPRADRKYALITNAYQPTHRLARGLCATLAKIDKNGQVHIISHASHQLKENEKNYSPFLLELTASVWGMDNYNEYLKGSQFTLFADPMPTPDLGTMQTKTLNRLCTAMSEHNFVVQNRQQSQLPETLKIAQRPYKYPDHTDNGLFNSKIHVDIFKGATDTDPKILSITDENTTYSTTKVISNDSPRILAQSLDEQWFGPFGTLRKYFSKKGRWKQAN
jgi:RNase H-like domain found in reverse transcriptase/Reverse transcriptase (RNA-dependent DNA polymerase)